MADGEILEGYRFMTPPTDRERLDAMKERFLRAETFIERADALECFVDRLAALEHERDALHEAISGDGSLIGHHALVALAQAHRLDSGLVDSYEDRAEHAEAALLSLQTATGWQPIETAPTDRDAILLSRDGWMLIGCWAEYSKYNAPKFTHWMPLAKPPAALLPDPAGTQSPKDPEDTFARGDGERLSDRPRTAPTERR